MKPAILFSVFILQSFFVFCQQPSFAYDTVVINLLVTDHDGKALATKVNVENRATHQTTAPVTNKEGKAACKLATGESYSITIPNSGDSYEYSIPDITISPVELVFKFHIEAVPQKDSSKEDSSTDSNAAAAVYFFNSKDFKITNKSNLKVEL